MNTQLAQSYRFEITGRPDFSYLKVKIPAHETLKVEASAMATMEPTLKMKTKLRGGLGRVLTGESLFINEFTAQNLESEIGIAPGSPGDIAHIHLNGDTIYLQSSAYLASTSGVTINTKWQGIKKGFFSGENLFLIKCSGYGDLWFNTYGSMIEIDNITPNFTVDTGHIVAFTDELDYSISAFGGYKSLFFSGEGLVCRFRGTGRLWIQSHNVSALAAWAQRYRKVKRRYSSSSSSD